VRFVEEDFAHEVVGFGGEVALEDLLPGGCADLGELLFVVVLVHGADLFLCGGAEHLDDLHQLVDCRLAREERVAQQHLADHGAHAPHVDGHCLVCSPEDELGSALLAGADLTDVGFADHKFLGRAEVAHLEHVRGGVDEQVLGFDVAVADLFGVDLGHRPEHLPGVEFD